MSDYFFIIRASECGLRWVKAETINKFVLKASIVSYLVRERVFLIVFCSYLYVILQRQM